MSAVLAILLCCGAESAVADPELPLIDSPAWPKGDRLELTWSVAPSAIELVATIGGVSRHMPLASKPGKLRASDQPICNRNRRRDASELASISFEDGDTAAHAGYAVWRGGADDLLVVHMWDQPDHPCVRGNREFKVCPRHLTAALRFHIPRGIKVHELIVEIDATGAARPLACSK